jgi:hypothetical protein
VKQAPYISVVVPVFNREALIGPCIESLLRLDYPAYEIIVVDNGSTDGTREIVARYPVTLLTDPVCNAYTARNLGTAQARGEIVAFTDSDCEVDPAWLTELARHYEQESVGGVGGDLVPCAPVGSVETFLSLGKLQIDGAVHAKPLIPHPGRFPSGAQGSANLSYRKSVLDEVGGFPEAFRTHGGSYELCWRVQAAGYTFMYEPAATVSHRMRGRVGAMARQFFAAGACQPYLLKQQTERVCYVKIRTYLWGNREFRCGLPVRALVTLDVCSMSVLLLLLGLLWPWLLLAVPLLVVPAFLGAMIKACEPAKRTGQRRWYLLYPTYHLICSYAFFLGRLLGGIRCGVAAC